jgi:SAM-dependent methyltransferase
LVLDVGSADGPSVGWMRGEHRQVTVDIYPDGLRRGAGVCASALALPFGDATFDVVGAFDVLEHCDQERTAMSEIARVLTPGGRLLMSVPAYRWAWSDHDVQAGHYRRYSRRRLVLAVERAGLVVQRVSYAFAGVFPMFVAERVARRIRRPETSARLAPVSPAVERALLALTSLDRRILAAGFNLPFGSSVFLAAVKPGEPHQG